MEINFMKIHIILLSLLFIGSSSCSQESLQPDNKKDNQGYLQQETKIIENSSLEKTEIEPIKYYEGIPPNHYPQDWNISWTWGGEYPNGFSVIKENVVIKGRLKPNPKLEKTLECPLDFLGMYHPWNHESKSDLKFLTATKTFDIILSEALATDVYLNEKISSKTFEVGERITFLHHMSEGWARMKIAGKVIELDFSNIAANDWPENIDTVHEWVQLPCEDKAGWVLFDDVILRNDVADYGYSLSSWGSTQDLTHKELEILLAEVNKRSD